MNTYYILAIFFLALSAYFGYLGSGQSSKDQLVHISEKFENLGEQISNLKRSGNIQEEIDEIDKKYQDLAKEYIKVLPAEAQSLLVEKEADKLAQINKSTQLISQISNVRESISKITKAFAQNGVVITFEDMTPPADLFTAEHFQLKIRLSDNEYWSVHLVDREPEKIGMMFVRIELNDTGQELLTNDSIVFRWVQGEKFGFSLNDNISEEAKRNVFEGLNLQIHPIHDADKQLETLVFNLVKYILAKNKASNTF